MSEDSFIRMRRVPVTTEGKSRSDSCLIFITLPKDDGFIRNLKRAAEKTYQGIGGFRLYYGALEIARATNMHLESCKWLRRHHFAWIRALAFKQFINSLCRTTWTSSVGRAINKVPGLAGMGTCAAAMAKKATPYLVLQGFTSKPLSINPPEGWSVGCIFLVCVCVCVPIERNTWLVSRQIPANFLCSGFLSLRLAHLLLL